MHGRTEMPAAHQVSGSAGCGGSCFRGENSVGTCSMQLLSIGNVHLERARVSSWSKYILHYAGLRKVSSQNLKIFLTVFSPGSLFQSCLALHAPSSIQPNSMQ